VDNPEKFKELLKKYNLSFILQIHTCSYPVKTTKVQDHVDYFRTYVKEAKSWGASFVNSHSGSDSWSFEDSIKFFEECIKIEKEEGILVLHETHRQRVLYNPFVTRDLLKRLPDLKVNADLSHWAVVCERLLDEANDDFWPEIIHLVAKQCYLVHARVGYAEGPQVPDPSAAEYKDALDAHEKWWNVIWKAQKERGDSFAYVEPEHGPPPYLHTLPHTNVPVADLWKVNSWVGRRVADTYFHNGEYNK